MKKNIYITPQTDIMEVAATNVLMVSAEVPSPAPGNINNDPWNGIIGG